MSSICNEEQSCSVESLMVKLGSEGHVEGSTCVSRHDGCYICGAFNPNWHVYSKPQNNSTKEPFFPFLEYHQPTASARRIEKESGKVAVCAVCFSFLTQQWRAFEEKETPIVKRIYWLKRPGSENPENFDKDFEQGYDIEEGMLNHGMTTMDVTTKDRHHSKVQSKSQSTAEQESTDTLLFTEEHSDDPPVEPFSSSKVLESSSVNKKMAKLEFCFVCSRQKPKEFMRSVHTRPQLKTETPFYPCLTKHNPAILAKKMDFLGKVLVCEACQKFLFRQWQVFQKNSTPLSERQYQLRSDPSLPREQQSQLSTMVCFICGVTQPATSGRFLYSRKHASGDPYYPFLNKLKPPPGAMPLTKQGLTRACSGCRKSLHRQWKEFEANHISEDEREYRIRNDGILATSSSSSLRTSFLQPSIDTETIPTVSTVMTVNERIQTHLACYTCGESCDKSSMRPIYTGQKTNPLKANFYFPFIALLEPPPGSRPLDHIGRTLVCKKCFKFLHMKWEQFEMEQVPPQMRIYAVDGKANIKLKSKSYFCYLCGVKCPGTHSTFKLHSYPHNGEGVQDGGSFFPFLASRKPKLNASPISSEGTALACEICFANLMVQWREFESSGLPEESNRWLRKYHVDFIVCYLCGKRTPRESCSSVSKSLVAFQQRSKIYRGSLMTNRKQDVVTCDECQRGIVPQDSGKALYAGPTHDTVQEETRRTEFSHLIPKTKKPVIVIDSSDSDDDNNPSLKAKRKSIYPRTYRHANASPMHYTPSASPGVSQPPAPIKDYPPSVSPSMQPSTSRSFAAALRKLAKQAMPTGTSSPATSSGSGSQPVSPTVSHTSSRSAGVSPSRNSPAANQTPPPPRCEGTISKERQPLVTERELHNITTPPMPPIPALESDSNPTTSEPNRVPSVGPHRHSARDQAEQTSHSKGHEVLPGVFSTKPRYQSESTMISEHGFPTEHGHHMVPYYLHGGRPDVPLFIPRGAPLPGPPPLLASKRDGADPNAVSPFFQGVYPPSIMDSPDMHFETWRQQRAVEHLRQQHERQERPVSSMSGHSDLASPKDNTSDKDKGKEGGSSGEQPSGHRMHYYNKSEPSSCPVHGHSPGEQHQHKHPAGRSEQLPTTKPDRPEEYNRLFLPPHPDGPAMLHPYIVHTSREGMFGPQHLGERQAEMLRERDRQEMMMHQRMMLDPREHMKVREEEWQRRQHRLRQEKEEHQREMAQYRHHLLQQQREMEQPRRTGEQSGLDHRRPDHRQADHRERSDKSPHTNERPMPENEIYRHYPFHHHFHPLPHDIRATLPFPDLSRKDGEVHRSHMEAIKDGRNPHHPHPFGLHDPHFRPFSEPYPFQQDRLSSRTSGSDRLFTDARWPAHTRPTYVNGDLRTIDIHSSDMRNKLSEDLSSRIKKESMGDLSNAPPTIKPKHHDKDKLQFLEGLGLVTLEKKKELTHGDPVVVKRKLEEPQEAPSQDDKASTVSNGREEAEETSSEGTTDAESGTTSTDTEISSKQYKEKVNFMARLGLVPPQTREEMEQSYEVKRSERKKRKKKGRGRPSKRSRKETVNNEYENGRSSIDAENLEGPLTRQKQQQLLEQGLLKQDVEDKPEENGDLNRNLSVKIKKEAEEDASSSYPYTQEKRYKSSRDSGRHQSPPISSESLASRPPPRLTLQSLTNMEDPFNNYNTPAFRPPYLRHTGLLSVSQDLNHHGVIPISQPLRPEPIRSTGISLSEQETREYLGHRGSPGVPPEYNRHYAMLPGHQGTSYDKMIPVHSRPEVDVEKRDLGSRAPLMGRKEHEYKWPGVESVMKAYFLHSGERDHELSFLQENANKLKSQHASLNEEASNLNTQMTDLVQAKKHLHDEKKVCQENLDRLHYFMQSFQR